MIISSGLIIFFGMLLLAIKLKPSTSLRLLGYPLAVDLGVSVIALLIHWGTFSGVMAAAFAGVLTSLFTTIARKIFGYISKGTYYPGIFKVM
jgi:hypothetical protein